jgi:type IV pilus assembly protein PilO
MNPRLEKILKLPIYQRCLILAAILAIIIGAFIYCLYLPRQKELSSLQQQKDSLQAKLQESRQIARNLPEFKAEYEKMKLQLDEALAELPNAKEIPTLLTSISSLAKENGLDILRFKPEGEKPKGFYAEVPVELKLSGSYNQVALFFQSVGDLSRIVNIGNLTMDNPKGGQNRTNLSINCLATTFRFLENPPSTTKGKGKGR